MSSSFQSSKFTPVESNTKERGRQILVSNIHSVDFKVQRFLFPLFWWHDSKNNCTIRGDSREIVDLRPRHSF